MKKNLFCMWLLLLAILFSVNTQAQMTIGGKKEPEAFSVLELLNKGGLRLPQMTTAERNAFAVKNNDKGNGLTIYNKTTNCVEYWNATRWVSLCEGTSQTVISPQPCVNVAADGTGCDQTFTVDDVDCPNGPFNISITAGGEYASLSDVDIYSGKFKINFFPNETVNIHTVLVRVTSTCTSLYKEFLFSQNGVDCTSMPYAVPTLTASATTICTGGAVYLSVPAATANLDKLIWTRNGVEVARGVNYYVATQKGEYNISMGAIGCNTNDSNKRSITESGSVTPVNLTALASNNGVICGSSGKVTLSVSGSGGASIVWFHNGKEEKTGLSVEIQGDSSIGEWFAATKDASCYSKPSNSIQVTKSEAAGGQIIVPTADVLVNGVPLTTFTAFCAGGSLDLSIANKISGVTYIWYNGNDPITVNPYIVPSSQSTISLRMVATDNSGAKCPAEQSVTEASVTQGSTPGQPTITGNATLCDGTTDLTIVPAATGTYTYTWYKDGVKMTETTPTITVSTPGSIYTATVKNATGCISPTASKTISANVSSLPVLSWISKPASATYGAKITLQTGIEYGPAISYTWTTDNSGASIIGSGASVSIQLPASGPDAEPLKVTVFAENACGKSVAIEHIITMNNACLTPSLKAQSNLVQNISAGGSVTVTVSGTNLVNPTYQWYKNTLASTTGGSAISGAVTASYTPSIPDAGNYYFYCIVTNDCVGNLTGTSDVFTVKASVNPVTIPDGTGTFTGRSCFDIAESNFNTDCGTQASRTASKADFNTTTVNTQTYTFTVVGAAVSKVRFVYVEPNGFGGKIIKSLTPDTDQSEALNISGAVKATVVYQSALSSTSAGANNGTAYGKTANDALSVDLYVVYNNKSDGSGTDVKLKLKAQIKDCACCGAMISTTEWRNFMCHNIGADTTLDPFKPSLGIIGTIYNPYPSVDYCIKGYHTPTPDEWKAVLKYNNVKALEPHNVRGQGGVWLGDYLFLPTNSTYSGFEILYQASTGNNHVGKGGTVAFTFYVTYFNFNPGVRSVRCMSDN